MLTLQVAPTGVVASHTASHNTGPVIDPLGDVGGAENTLIVFDINGTDADGDHIIFEMISGPAGAVLDHYFVDTTVTPSVAKAEFSWTPGFDDAGVHEVEVRLRDEFASDFLAFNVTVTNTNRAPTITFIHNSWIDELERLTKSWQASDPDGDDVTLTLESDHKQVGQLPANMNFSDGGLGDGALEWTPDCTQGAIPELKYHFWANVTDGQATFTREFNIYVTDINTAPSIVPVTHKKGIEGGFLSFTINATACEVEDHFIEVGLRGATLGGITPPPLPEPLPNQALPQGASVDPEAPLPMKLATDYYAYFNWTIGYQQNGNYSFYANVTDGAGLYDNVTFNIFINDTNTAPELYLPDFDVPADEEYFAREDVALTNRTSGVGVWHAWASDMENDIVFWEIDWLDVPGVQVPPGMTVIKPDPAVPANESFLEILWIPTYEQAGEYNFRLSVSDGARDVTKNFTICVENTNRVPYINPLPNLIIPENETVVVKISGHDYDFQDPTYPDDLTLRAFGLPAGSDFHDGHVEETIFFEGNFRWTPSFSQAGTYTITFVADDSDTDVVCPGNTVFGPLVSPPPANPIESFTIVVLNVDRPPVLQEMEDQTWLVETPIVVPIKATDPDLDPITLSSPDLPAGATLTDNGDGTGQIDWTPAVGDAGTYVITVKACSGAVVQCDEKTVTIIVIQETDYEIRPEGASILQAAPGVPVTLAANVTNTGPAGFDTISFTASVTNNGVVAADPAPVTVHAGNYGLTSFDVVVPQGASQFFVTLTAKSALDPALIKTVKWRIDVPVVLNLTFTNTLPGTVEGFVDVRFLDDSPAANVPVTVTQKPQTNPAGLLTSSVSGISDGSGVYSFSFAGDAGASTPGTHSVLVQADYFGRTYSFTGSYVVPA